MKPAALFASILSLLLFACASQPAPKPAAPERDLSAYQPGEKTEFDVAADAPEQPKAAPAAHPIYKPTVASQTQKRGLFVVTKKSD